MPYDKTFEYNNELNESLFNNFYIITGNNNKLWKIIPILLSNGFSFLYESQIIIIDLNKTEF